MQSPSRSSPSSSGRDADSIMRAELSNAQSERTRVASLRQNFSPAKSITLNSQGSANGLMMSVGGGEQPVRYPTLRESAGQPSPAASDVQQPDIDRAAAQFLSGTYSQPPPDNRVPLDPSPGARVRATYTPPVAQSPLYRAAVAQQAQYAETRAGIPWGDIAAVVIPLILAAGTIYLGFRLYSGRGKKETPRRDTYQSPPSSPIDDPRMEALLAEYQRSREQQ